MASLTIRMDDDLKQRLRAQAVRNGRSMAEEVRQILRDALSITTQHGSQVTCARQHRSLNSPCAIHPGELLREAFLKELGMTHSALARALNVSASTIRDIVRERRNITAVMAIRLGRYFGTSAQLWMNLQSVHSLTKAYAERSDEIEREIKPFKPPTNLPPA
ncbi:HigA family addiction module antitoxin [Ectopseudomonas composti]|uniref:HigA family addiction module antitoxin n=1 Tax=Ectopseudomonas composti TaxID=658457 RepID=UPI001E2856A8|nr:HigA family addiction module antitoxin [Pseudomonas composti]